MSRKQVDFLAVTKTKMVRMAKVEKMTNQIKSQIQKVEKQVSAVFTPPCPSSWMHVSLSRIFPSKA